MKLKKILAVASALTLSAGMLSAYPTAGEAEAAGAKYNYGEALQKSMFFYEVQQSGKLPDWNSVGWRADSMLKEDGTPADVVDGGWFDAGDHFKFTLTNAYTASVMAWGIIEYKDAVKKAGLYDLYMNNLLWGLDYISRCDLGDEVIGTIGPDGFDHKWWGSPEVYIRKYAIMDGKGKEDRPYDTMTCSTVTGYMAAALAEGAILLKDENPSLAESYLKQAKSLFERADKVRSDSGQGVQKSYYNIEQHGDETDYIDELMYAANWLYRATGDQSYLDKCKNDYIPKYPLENQSTDRKYTWGFCWDDSSQAAALLYAQNTGDEEWIAHVKKHLSYWMGLGSSAGVKAFDNITPGGLSYLFQWGCLRHATTTAWLAKLATDTILKDDASFAAQADKWADSQMNYCFGDNEMGISYVLGMGDEWPQVFHHRGASGIHDDHWNELGSSGKASTSGESWQTEYAHTLYGALIGGPDSKGNYGSYSVSDYQYTEVAIDYNAGYTAALCAMIDDYGGTPLADFPPAETPKWAEWEVAAVLNGQPASSYTEIKAWAMNHTAWPARVAKDVKFRYFFDVSELFEKGMSVDQITVETKAQQYSEGEQGYAKAAGPFKYEGDPTGNTYYAEIYFEDGRAIMPTGQSEHRDEVQFRVSIPDAIDGQSTAGAWDASNDWSYLGGLATASDLKKADSLNEHITMYVDGVLVWGEEPDGSKPKIEPVTKPGGTNTQPSTEAPKPTEQPTEQPTEPEATAAPETDAPEGPTSDEQPLYGDANLDGKINVSDVVAVLQYVANQTKYPLKGIALVNADVDGVPGITGTDAIYITKYDASVITKFPVES